VGDPLPPVIEKPATIQDLDAARRGNQGVIIFSLPQGPVEWVEIYRHCNPLALPGRFQLITRIAEDEFVSAERPGSFRYVVGDRNDSCRYLVRFVDNRGQKSDSSNIVSLAPTVTPDPD